MAACVWVYVRCVRNGGDDDLQCAGSSRKDDRVRHTSSISLTEGGRGDGNNNMNRRSVLAISVAAVPWVRKVTRGNSGQASVSTPFNTKYFTCTAF